MFQVGSCTGTGPARNVSGAGHVGGTSPRQDNVAPETAPIQPVSDEHVDQVLPYLPEVVRDMVQLQRLTGMRPGELVIMRPADVDRS